MRLTAIHVYPIKSCAGVSLPEATVVRRGLEHDRRFMIVDRDGKFITQREQPRMALVSTAIEDDALVVSTGVATLRRPLEPEAGDRRAVKVWDDTCEAVEDHELGAFFAEHLRIDCSAVFMPDDTERRVDPTRAKPEDITGFADGFPLLIIGEASLSDLQGRVDVPLTMTRFRTNLVFDGGAPYEEDGWTGVRIGEASFRAVKRCSRCTITTVDPETGESDAEPLKTLATYRKDGKHVYFGMNLIHDGPAKLSVGDEVEPCRSTP